MNTTNKHFSRPLWFTAILLTAFITGCGNSNDTSTTDSTNPNDPTDPAALKVTLTNPADAATAVATNQEITATFSEPMDETTLNELSFTVIGANESAMIGTVTLDAPSNTAIFTPGSNLTISTVYTATITTAAESLTGKTMASDHIWSFTSGAGPDSVAPTVSKTDPAPGATNFFLNRNITASFSESLNPTTVTDTSFTLKETLSGNLVPGVVSYNDNGMVATFNPDVNLDPNVDYTATFTTGVKDLAGNALTDPYPWTFSGTETTPTLLPVELGTAGNFAILAKTGISKTGTTSIIGDIGVSPEALTAITGFSITMDSSNEFATSDFVTGSIYAADMAVPTPANMTTAISNMETAFTDAAGRTLPDFTELGAGNITGMTLTPGLYKWGTNVLINPAGVTISGSPTDVWIFQIAQDLILENAARVTLEGGALAKNIFWQVSGGISVSMGTTAHLEGIVLAQKAITVNTGATVNGRLLAQSAVTLDANTVTEPPLQ